MQWEAERPLNSLLTDGSVAQGWGARDQLQWIAAEGFHA